IAFGLEERGIKYEPLGLRHGPDTDELDSDEESNSRDIHGFSGNPDADLSRCLGRFGHDVFQVTANIKGRNEPSHLLINSKDRTDLRNGVFMSLDMTRLFERIQLRRYPTTADWKRTFDHYFPPKGGALRLTGETQNFPHMHYFSLWTTLMSRLAKDHSEVVRAQVFQYFNTFKWIPAAAGDRVWTTT
ncbi:hypothetical protein C8J56DRAFT_760770, partial [Mycena floridula]